MYPLEWFAVHTITKLKYIIHLTGLLGGPAGLGKRESSGGGKQKNEEEKEKEGEVK